MLGFADIFGGVAGLAANGNTAPGGSAEKEREASAPASAAAPSPFPSLPAAAPLVALLLVSLAFAYLWFAAGSEAGTLSRLPWYAAALAQGWLALLALQGEYLERREANTTAAPPAKRFAMSGSGALLAVLLGAPLLHATLLELLLHDADRGGLYTAPTAWVGRAVAAASVVAAAALLVRRVRRGGARA
jgi:hypothetical protein